LLRFISMDNIDIVRLNFLSNFKFKILQFYVIIQIVFITSNYLDSIFFTSQISTF